MASEALQNLDRETLWSGKESPFSVSYGKMMMWFFLISDALTFGGLLTAVGFFRHKYAHIWPSSEEVFHAFPGMGHTDLPLMYVALMTFILIVSSVTMVLAVEAGHRMDKKGVTKWLALTVVGGLFFVLSQVWEWSHFIHGSELGAVQIKGRVLEQYGVSGQLTTNGLVAQWANEEGERLEYISQLNLNAEQTEELDHMIHNLHHTSGVPKKEIALHQKEYIEFMGGLGLQLRMPTTNEEGKNLIIPSQSEDIKKVIESAVPIFGASLTGNQYGARQYSQFFFFVTGFHGFHVFSGVVINLIILIGVVKGVYHARGHYEMVEKTGLYWHFVDLVWVFVFTFFYLV